jgi:hypothetical protein
VEEWRDKPRKDLDLDVKLMNWLRNLFTRETPPTKEELIQAERIKKILDSIKSEEKGGLISMLNVGGQPSIDAQVQNLASKGRYGDTMLMHVNPKEVAGLGGLTINPDTGLPEAFWAMLPFLAKAMIIGAGVGAGRKALGGSGSWLQNLLGGAALGAGVGGLAGPTGLGLMGAPAAAAGPTTTAVGSAAASGAIPNAFLGATQAAGAGTTAVPSAFLGATQAAGGAGGAGLTNAPLASTASPSWLDKIGGLWQTGVEAHPFRTASTLGTAAAMLPSEQTYTPDTNLASLTPTTSGFGPFIPKEPREVREDAPEEFYTGVAEEGGDYEFFASSGGLVSLQEGGYLSPPPPRNVFEGRVQGQGDGMADQIPFNVVPQTPEDAPKTPDMALLSSDEYVVPADVVSMLGNGSSTAGAQALDQFNQLMRKKAHGTNRQQREINSGKELSSLV